MAIIFFWTTAKIVMISLVVLAATVPFASTNKKQATFLVLICSLFTFVLIGGIVFFDMYYEGFLALYWPICIFTIISLLFFIPMVYLDKKKWEKRRHPKAVHTMLLVTLILVLAGSIAGLVSHILVDKQTEDEQRFIIRELQPLIVSERAKGKFDATIFTPKRDPSDREPFIDYRSEQQYEEPASSIRRRGKVIIYDMVTERILGADGLHHAQVWRSIDGIDKPTTLFVVMEKDSKYRLIDIYPISKQPAYQQMANVCILYWPAREVAGMVKIESLLPPRERTVRQQPEYGELEPAIKEWIDGLADK